MSLKAEIKVGLKLGDTIYNITLDIPTAVPTGELPFRFTVEGTTPGGTGESSKLLNVAVGGTDQFYVQVAPPQALIKEAAGDTIKDLEVVVNDGDYDPITGLFLSV